MKLAHLADHLDSGDVQATGDWLGAARWRVAIWGDDRGGRFGLGTLTADPFVLMRAACTRDPLVVWGEHARLTIRLTQVDRDCARFDVLSTQPPKKNPRRGRKTVRAVSLED